MILLPTEKRFDWSSPPFVLLLLIFLNVFIYYFYQSRDSDREYAAINHYVKADLLKKEVRPYADFLAREGRKDDAKQFEELKKMNDQGYLAYVILGDKAFGDYVNAHSREIYNDPEYSTFLTSRNEAFALFYSRSDLRFGLVPNDIGPVTLISYQFMHGGFMHLFGNMFFLVICGFAVEAAIGHARFLLFYLLSGIAAGLSHAALDFHSSMPLVGASGAISGVMAMYLWVFRLKKIEFFYWFYVFVGYVRLPALTILPLYIGKEVFSYFAEQGSNVAFMAHAGGFVCGSVLMAGLLWWKPDTLDEDYIEKDDSIDPYCQKLAEVYNAMEQGHFRLAQKHLADLLAAHDETIELSLLRYHLMKSQPGNALADAFSKVMSYTKLNTAELARTERVWNESPHFHSQFSDEQLVKLGMRFAALPGLETAEKLFAELLERHCPHHTLGVFARKLAIHFEKLKNPTKATYYAALADNSLGGAA